MNLPGKNVPDKTGMCDEQKYVISHVFWVILGNTEVHLTHECNKSRFFQVEFIGTVNEEYSTALWAWEVAVLPSANVQHDDLPTHGQISSQHPH